MLVAKTVDPQHLSESLHLDGAAWQHVASYIVDLQASGVTLPDDIEVTACGKEIQVQHRWAEGTGLRQAARTDPDLFVHAVHQIAAWVSALSTTASRLDTNLENFVVDPSGGIMCVDVLPPIRTDLARAPNSPWQEIVNGLCFDIDITVCALAGYAQHALAATDRRGPGSSPSIRALCRGHRPGSLPAQWFHARLIASEHLDEPPARRLWDATSVSALLGTPASARPARTTRALELIRPIAREYP